MTERTEALRCLVHDFIMDLYTLLEHDNAGSVDCVLLQVLINVYIKPTKYLYTFTYSKAIIFDSE